MKLFFDFDSTFIKSETLDQLALRQQVSAVEAITQATMAGKLDFHEALLQRLACLNTQASAWEELVNDLPVSDSVQKHRAWFVENHESIYIVSGGFKEVIIPIVAPFGIPPEHVFANHLIDGKLDITNPLAYSFGKAKVIANLTDATQEFSIMIGDGYNDLEVRQAGKVAYFFAYVENVYREVVASQADAVVENMDQLIQRLGEFRERIIA